MLGDGEFCVFGWIYCVDKILKERCFWLIYFLLCVIKLFYLCNIYYYILVYVKRKLNGLILFISVNVDEIYNV